MKQKLYITGSVLLLLIILFFIIKDLLFRNKGDIPNPYEYNLNELRKSDSLYVAFNEIKQFSPEIEEIYGIAVDRSDRIFVSGKDRIEIYYNTGKLEKRFDINGIARSIKVDDQGNIYLGIDNHIEVYDHEGNLLKKWKAESPNSVLTSIAVGNENIFVADAGEKVVYRYDRSGKLINRIGQKDPQRNIPGFVVPSYYFDLGISPAGQLWIADPGRHKFMNFGYDGTLLTTWGKSSVGVDGFCGCCNPSHFTFLPDGSFITSEKGIERIKVYKPDGTYKYLVASPDSFEEGTRGLDLAVDSQERILVIDPVRKKVRFFVKKEQ